MKFDWDELKRRENVRLRKVDFAEAALIFAGRVIASEDNRQNYGERRFRALGQAGGKTYVVAYTDRGEVRHIITAWEVGTAGARRYRALLSRGTSEDA